MLKPWGVRADSSTPLRINRALFYCSAHCRHIAARARRGQEWGPKRSIFKIKDLGSLKTPIPSPGLPVRKAHRRSLSSTHERALREVTSSEVEHRPVESADEVTPIVDQIVTGPRLLSDDLPACASVLHRTDQPHHCDILLHLAHCIMDGISNYLLLKIFLDLRTRLGLTFPSEDLFPSASFSPPRRSWIRVISLAISSNRMAKLSMRGGHTLPRKITSTTMFTPAHSDTKSYSLSVEDSRRVIRNCTRHQVTFGNVYPRYLRGEIDEDESEYRKREPMSTAGGPLDLPSYYNREWQHKGGAHNVSVFIGFDILTLPFMPLGETRNIKPGMPLPTLSQLLTPSLFFLRSRLIEQQMANMTRNLLSLDVLNARLLGRVQTLREIVQAVNRSPQMTRDLTLLTPMEQSRKGIVITHGGFSLGNVDRLLPLEYGSENGIKIALHRSGTRLHCRPMELYLGAETSRDQSHLYFFFDKNVFDREVVEEWLAEIQAATLHSIGGDVAN
ncbi:hypothetical protein BDN72DRAFT_891369 [Pluteus cervinus]|uniref:Uncharacterized protein n=1 Tax=Pluteus cervinus TaxID=181527 RepID=A0ACD3BEH4_9AGAR|nr:hypothetical protein BDN72DRAFT_891369 [Pluteus cervinus]